MSTRSVNHFQKLSPISALVRIMGSDSERAATHGKLLKAIILTYNIFCNVTKKLFESLIIPFLLVAHKHTRSICHCSKRFIIYESNTGNTDLNSSYLRKKSVFFLSKFYVALLHSESQWNVSSNCTYSFKIAFLYCYLMLSLCLDKNSFKTHSLLQLNIYLGWLLYYLSILQPLVN